MASLGFIPGTVYSTSLSFLGLLQISFTGGELVYLSFYSLGQKVGPHVISDLVGFCGELMC